MAKQYHISEVGEFLHPWFNKPDTEFNDDGLFHTKLIVAGPQAQSMVEKIEAAAQAAFDEFTDEMTPAQKKGWSIYLPFEHQLDDEGNETGNYVFTFKQNAKIKDKDVKIEIRNAADKIIDEQIWSGSEGRILYTARPIKVTSSKKAGVRLDFFKVQVTKLVKGSKGFGVVQGGYGTEDQDSSDTVSNEEDY
ncbi:MAG: hypothetical protein JJ891_06950 [Rhizobiaceae bacterium]|nr:hypothetical protein [Rhizobiaceae bacterium]